MNRLRTFLRRMWHITPMGAKAYRAELDSWYERTYGVPVDTPYMQAYGYLHVRKPGVRYYTRHDTLKGDV